MIKISLKYRLSKMAIIFLSAKRKKKKGMPQSLGPDTPLEGKIKLNFGVRDTKDNLHY
jgi:hypothetical protein